MHFRTSRVSARPRSGRRGRRYLLLIPLTLVLSLAATGLALPASKVKSLLDARTTTLEKAVANAGFAKSVHTDIATNMVGFSWNGANRGTVEFRTLSNGTWSEWNEIDGDPSEGPDVKSPEHRAQTSAGPVWVGEGVHDVQVRVKDGSMPGLRFHAIRSQSQSGSSPSIKSAGADPAWPNVILRGQWGADESWRNCPPEYASNVRYGIVHHTANSNNYSPDQSASIVRGIYYFHTHTNGWCDIGYNFLVDRYGRIFEGRYGGVTAAVVGAHAGGFNTGSTGVSMIGDFTGTSVPPPMYDALKAILVWKFFVHRVDANRVISVVAGDFSGSRYPAGTVVNLWTISGHRDVDQTDCPGNAAYPLLAGLRRDVQTDLTNTQPWPYGWYNRASSGPGALVLTNRGGLYPSGSQGAVTQSGFWPYGDTARAAVRFGGGGLVVDLFGGLHSFGGAPQPTDGPYWPGRDVVRGLAKGPSPNSGYVLDNWGALHPFGGAPPAVGGPYWPNQDVPRGVVTRADGVSGYVLDRSGALHPFGGAPAITASGYWPNQDIARGIALRPDGKSGYVLDSNGGVHPFGGAPAAQSAGYWPGRDFARGIIANGTAGGWVVSADGGVWSFGGAPGLPASMMWSGMNLAKAIV